jgi:rhodanese-related sulfurtransferase
MDHVPVTNVNADEAHRLVDEGALLVDVREANEWDHVRIPGAHLHPMSTINDWWQQLPKDRTVVLQCRSGQRSGNVARALMTQAGFTNVVNLAGGIIAWAEAELPLEGGGDPAGR